MWNNGDLVTILQSFSLKMTNILEKERKEWYAMKNSGRVLFS